MVHNHCIVQEGATNRTVALDHNQRRRVIQSTQGFMIRRLQPKTWGGLFIADALPREGRRVHKHRPWDENVGGGTPEADRGEA